MPTLDDAQSALERHFGFSRFREGQDDVIEDVLAGQDVIVVMPTGGGKSLCYQLPALLFPGLTLVISPLIALMKDQVDALNARDIPATYINSSLSYDDQLARLRGMSRGEYRLVYIAPERFRNARFVESLKGCKILALRGRGGALHLAGGARFSPRLLGAARGGCRVGGPADHRVDGDGHAAGPVGHRLATRPKKSVQSHRGFRPPQPDVAGRALQERQRPRHDDLSDREEGQGVRDHLLLDAQGRGGGVGQVAASGIDSRRVSRRAGRGETLADAGLLHGRRPGRHCREQRLRDGG